MLYNTDVDDKLSFLKDKTELIFKLDDLSKKTRERKYADARKAFCRVAYDIIIKNKTIIASKINRPHDVFIYYESVFDGNLLNDEDLQNKYMFLNQVFIDKYKSVFEDEIKFYNQKINYLQKKIKRIERILK